MRGQSPLGALAIGAALGALLVLLPLMFDPIPTPLSREQWPIRLPVLRRLARIRHWANPFYVEQISLHSGWRRQYCAEQLAASLLRFPWLPSGPHNIAGRTRDDSFVLKRTTWWHDGMRPTGAGRFVDSGPGTDIVLSVAAPAIGAYFLLLFLTIALTFMVTAIVAATVRPPQAGIPPPLLVLIILGGALLTFAFIALFASPVPIPLGKTRTEGDEFIDFFGDVLGADVVSRE